MLSRNTTPLCDKGPQLDENRSGNSVSATVVFQILWLTLHNSRAPQKIINNGNVNLQILLDFIFKKRVMVDKFKHCFDVIEYRKPKVVCYSSQILMLIFNAK